MKNNKKMELDIDNNGEYVSDQWFDVVWPFFDDFAKVELNDKWRQLI